MEVKDRHDLYSKFTEIMNNVYDTRKEHKKQNYKQNMIKTYLIEGHIGKENDPSHDDFNRFFKDDLKKRDFKLEIYDTEEEYLFKLVLNEIEFFLDAANDRRFWMIHTSEKTEKTDESPGSFCQYCYCRGSIF